MFKSMGIIYIYKHLMPVSSSELCVTGYKWGKRPLHLCVSVKSKSWWLKLPTTCC